MDTIRRSLAEAELDQMIPMYRDGGEGWMRYEELYDEVDAEGSALPPEQWRDGYWDADQYIVEATEVGIYERVDTVATIVTRYANDKSMWTYEQLRDAVFPARVDDADTGSSGGHLKFDDWLAESLKVGTYRKVDVVEYRNKYEDELVTERLIVSD